MRERSCSHRNGVEQLVSKQVAPMPRLKPGEGGGGGRTRTDGDLMVSVLRAGWSENMEDQASGRMKIVDGRASKLPNTTLPDTIWSEEWPRLFLKRKRRGDCSLAPRKGKIVRSSPKQKTTPKTTVDTEQFTRSKEHQLRIWQQQDTWREIPDSLAWLERPTMQFPLTWMCRRRKFRDYCDC